ncbi:MAG: DUF4349 domain-containing protein [Planctomycetota bacterium]
MRCLSYGNAFCLAAALLVLAVGCGQAARESARAPSYAYDVSDKPASAAPVDAGRLARFASDDGVAESLSSPPADGSAAAEPAAAAARKIIYQARVDLVVEDFSPMEGDVARLIAEHGGYLANLQLSRNTGDNRSGRWVARVPVDRFEAFLAAVSTLGVPERREQSGQDVTAEFVDLEARLAAKQKFEARLLKLVEERTDGVKDLIEVERELSRVRGEIEQMQGRRRYLVNQTSLTTVTLNAREEQDYTPPEAPGFGRQIAAAWSGSLGGLQEVGAGCVLLGVRLAPWLLVAGAVVVPTVWWLKPRRGNEASPAAPQS